MVQTKVKKIEPSKYGKKTYLAIYDFNKREVYSTINKKVLKYLNVNSVQVGDVLEVIKTFGSNDKPVYLIKRIYK